MTPRARDWFGAALLFVVLAGLCALLVLLAVSDEATAVIGGLLA